MKYFLFAMVLLINSHSFSQKKQSKNLITYPTTNKIAHTDTYFGTIVEDPYQWLEDDTSA